MLLDVLTVECVRIICAFDVVCYPTTPFCELCECELFGAHKLGEDVRVMVIEIRRERGTGSKGVSV